MVNCYRSFGCTSRRFLLLLIGFTIFFYVFTSVFHIEISTHHGRSNKNQIGGMQSHKNTIDEIMLRSPASSLRQEEKSPEIQHLQHKDGATKSKPPLSVLNATLSSVNVSVTDVGSGKRKQLLTDLDETFSDDQIPRHSPLPDDAVLNKTIVKELSDLYYSHVNTLQILCPVKTIVGGLLNGVYVCHVPSHIFKCSAIHISSVKGESKILKDMRRLQNCTGHLVPEQDFERDLRDEGSILRQQLTKEKVDVLILDNGKAEMVKSLTEGGYMSNVQQLIIRILLKPQAADKEEVRQWLIQLRRLYDGGFRIYHKERHLRCVYAEFSTACYTVYMIRNIPVTKPVVIPNEDVMRSMTQEDVFRLFHRYAVSTQTLCSDVVRLGHIADGGWDLCNDDKYRPTKPCLVYSFGIANDWTFDDQISKRYGCEVHAFDPSIDRKNGKLSDKIYFYNLGISGSDGMQSKWDMKTLSSIKDMLGHTDKTIDVLKMDVEASEWASLDQILSSGVLSKVRQLYIEFHYRMLTVNEKYMAHLSIFRRLYDQGMRVFWSHPNQYHIFQTNVTGSEVSCCYEISYINVNL